MEYNSVGRGTEWDEWGAQWPLALPPCPPLPPKLPFPKKHYSRVSVSPTSQSCSDKTAIKCTEVKEPKRHHDQQSSGRTSCTFYSGGWRPQPSPQACQEGSAERMRPPGPGQLRHHLASSPSGKRASCWDLRTWEHRIYEPQVMWHWILLVFEKYSQNCYRRFQSIPKKHSETQDPRPGSPALVLGNAQRAVHTEHQRPHQE